MLSSLLECFDGLRSKKRETRLTPYVNRDIPYTNPLGKMVIMLPSQFEPWTAKGTPLIENFEMDDMGEVPISFKAVEPDCPEWRLIEALHMVKQPKTIGTGNDAQTGWRKGEGEAFIKVRAIWKVTNSKTMEEYLQEIDKLQHFREEEHWVETVNDGVQRELRAEGLTTKHEYLLLHGSCPENLKSILKTGINRHVASQTSWNFGTGSYLADAADKADQHLAPDEARNLALKLPQINDPPQEKLPYITSIVGNDDKQLEQIRESMNEQGENAGRICIGLVVRAALGNCVEVQLAENMDKIEKNKNDVGARSDFHWHNPWTKEKMTVKAGDCVFEERVPPWGKFREAYDSVKVMCGMYNPEYQKEWSEIIGNGPATNAFPFRFNEYLVPFADKTGPRVAVQYLVAYERRRGDKGA